MRATRIDATREVPPRGTRNHWRSPDHGAMARVRRNARKLAGKRSDSRKLRITTNRRGARRLAKGLPFCEPTGFSEIIKMCLCYTGCRKSADESFGRMVLLDVSKLQPGGLNQGLVSAALMKLRTIDQQKAYLTILENGRESRTTSARSF